MIFRKQVVVICLPVNVLQYGGCLMREDRRQAWGGNLDLDRPPIGGWSKSNAGSVRASEPHSGKCVVLTGEDDWLFAPVPRASVAA